MIFFLYRLDILHVIQPTASLLTEGIRRIYTISMTMNVADDDDDDDDDSVLAADG